MSARVLITGGAGLVGGWLATRTPPETVVHATVRTTPARPDARRRLEGVHHIELTDPRQVAAVMDAVVPDVVVHAAYGRNHDDIVEVTANVARACATSGAALIHLSSDTVFGGRDAPYVEDDEPDPVNAYGRWKAQGEVAAFAAVPDVAIARFSLVVSTDPPDLATAGLLAASRRGAPVRLFTDEVRSAIRVEDLVRQLWALIDVPREERGGVWHLPGPEALSRHEIGLRRARSLHLDSSIIEPASAAGHPEPRPRVLRLSGRRISLLGVAPPEPI